MENSKFQNIKEKTAWPEILKKKYFMIFQGKQKRGF